MAPFLQVDDAEWKRLAAADFSSPTLFEDLPLAERWVLSSLHSTTAAITAAHVSSLLDRSWALLRPEAAAH